MKRLLILLAAITVLYSCKSENNNITPNNKAAILLVHFGTTHANTRSLTIDSLNSRVAHSFPEYDVFEAYTSRIIIKHLKKDGIEKLTPQQALEKLHASGYSKVIVQPTNIISGKENQTLKTEIESVRPLFTEIKIGKPLLFSIEDSFEVVKILAQRNKTSEPNHHVLFVGHGTDDPATALYSQTDYIFKTSGHTNYHVATIEGFPAMENAISLLKEHKAKKVTLAPFMFVAGDHAVNDISEEWKAAIEEAGFNVALNIEGLGQIPQIQDIFIAHIIDAINKEDENLLNMKNDILKN